MNIVKIENLNANFLIKLNPKNWFKKRPVLSKDTIDILFIDDLDMPVVKNLEKAGYRVVRVKDVKDVDDVNVKNAHIVFVDFDGVGKSISPIHQGAGLVKEIKTKYGDSKYVVLYTAQTTLPTDTIMKSLFDAADDRLRKDADVTDFLEQIRNAIKKLQ